MENKKKKKTGHRATRTDTFESITVACCGAGECRKNGLRRLTEGGKKKDHESSDRLFSVTERTRGCDATAVLGLKIPF